jgi:SAM-dependent methyltransferase
MVEHARHDAWQAGDSYDAYMGRWSRRIAPLFLDLLDVPHSADWLELGCGTGVLTEAITDLCDPVSVIALDPSEGFLTSAREKVPGNHVTFRTANAESLAGMTSASFDVAVSGLVLNFVPDRIAALREMKRLTRPGGTVAFYVWDYPGGGVEFMRAFWTAAVALDPNAGDLTEDKRFPFCTEEGLHDLARDAGLEEPTVTRLEASSKFSDFEDYWHPFTLGAGPAPGYCISLSAEARERLRGRLSETLPRQPDGSIPLTIRAWAVISQVK